MSAPCRVSDPTGVIWGIKLYQTIIANLFDPQQSSIKLKGITVESPTSLVASWTKEGFLQLPWKPYLTTQEGKTVSAATSADALGMLRSFFMTCLRNITVSSSALRNPVTVWTCTTSSIPHIHTSASVYCTLDITSPVLMYIPAAAVLYTEQQWSNLCTQADVGQHDAFASNQDCIYTNFWQKAITAVRNKIT